jgi:hypothetical protein
MPHYVINYDLRAPGRNYDGLYKLLGEWRAVSALQSMWFATLRGPASTIRDILKAEVDANDGLFVVEITSTADWASRGLPPAAADWLQRNVP